MNARPYVGITGPVSVDEVKAVSQEFSDAGYTLNSEHVPMMGFLFSYKTINGQPTENRRYPSLNQLPELLKATNPSVFPMLHYNTREKDTLAGQVDLLFDGIYGDHLCRAIQLNIIWPEPREVRKIKDRFPEMQVVFQLSGRAKADKTPQEIARDIGVYGNCLDYLLIDPSGGRCFSFDIQDSLGIYREIREKLPDIRVGFAGGLNGHNTAPVLQELIRQTGETNFCIDAEGGLRDKVTDTYGDDLLSLPKVKAYLQSASRILK